MPLLFHYHWWTDKVEEMEKFYSNLGFQTVLRLGKYQGEMKTFSPPITWDNFRDFDVQFRIIEMRKGKTNLTFGYGKRNQFDHIGFLVDDDEYHEILERAEGLNWKVNEGERRTFIGTPWRLRIELQRRWDVVSAEENMNIEEMQISLPFKVHPTCIATLLNLTIKHGETGEVILTDGKWDLAFVKESQLNLKSIQFNTMGQQAFHCMDPLKTALYTNNYD